jgi:hypothetical protein
MMRLVPNLAAALVAAAVPLAGSSVMAAPLSQPLAVNNANVGAVEQVQYRYRSGRWIGPAAAGFAAGAIIGGALAPRYYDEGYYAYGAAPGYYAYGAAPGYVVTPGYYDAPLQRWQRASPQYGSCTGDRYADSGYPSWACR